MKLFAKIKKGDLEVDPNEMDIAGVRGMCTEEENERVYGADIQALKRKIGNQGIYALYLKKLVAWNKVIETDRNLMTQEDWAEYSEVKRWCTYYSVKSGVDYVKTKTYAPEAVLKNIDLNLDEINFGKRLPP